MHEENLAYLLGEGFSFDQAWDQTLATFHEVAKRVARHSHEPLILRAIVPLTDAMELIVAVPEPPALLKDVSDFTPPKLILMPPRLSVDHRRFEEYRVGLATDLDAAVTYSAARSLEHPHDGVWTRSLMLERLY